MRIEFNALFSLTIKQRLSVCLSVCMQITRLAKHSSKLCCTWHNDFSGQKDMHVWIWCKHDTTQSIIKFEDACEQGFLWQRGGSDLKGSADWIEHVLSLSTLGQSVDSSGNKLQLKALHRIIWNVGVLWMETQQRSALYCSANAFWLQWDCCARQHSSKASSCVPRSKCSCL